MEIPSFGLPSSPKECSQNRPKPRLQNATFINKPAAVSAPLKKEDRDPRSISAPLTRTPSATLLQSIRKKKNKTLHLSAPLPISFSGALSQLKTFLRFPWLLLPSHHGLLPPVFSPYEEPSNILWPYEFTSDTSIKTPEETVMRQHMQQDMYELLKGLHPRETQVLVLRYGFWDGQCKSLEEIARIFKCTKEWIRKIEKSALTKLRKEEVQRNLSQYLKLQL